MWSSFYQTCLSDTAPAISNSDNGSNHSRPLLLDRAIAYRPDQAILTESRDPRQVGSSLAETVRCSGNARDRTGGSSRCTHRPSSPVPQPRSPFLGPSEASSPEPSDRWAATTRSWHRDTCPADHSLLHQPFRHPAQHDSLATSFSNV